MTMNSKDASEAEPRGEGGVEAFFPKNGLPKLPEITPGRLYKVRFREELYHLEPMFSEFYTGPSFCLCQLSDPKDIPEVFMAITRPIIFEWGGDGLFTVTRHKEPIGRVYVLAVQALLGEKYFWLILDQWGLHFSNIVFARKNLRSAVRAWKSE